MGKFIINRNARHRSVNLSTLWADKEIFCRCDAEREREGSTCESLNLKIVYCWQLPGDCMISLFISLFLYFFAVGKRNAMKCSLHFLTEYVV